MRTIPPVGTLAGLLVGLWLLVIPAAASPC
jgi:hypothetical protein